MIRISRPEMSISSVLMDKDGEGADRATGSETCGSDVQRTIQTDTESEPSELGEQGEISPDLSEGDSGVLF